MRPFHLVICRDDDGSEYPDMMVPHEADIDVVVSDLMGGQWDRPMQVILVDPEPWTCVDVSKDVAMAIARRVKWEGYQLGDIARAFLEHHVGQQVLNELPEAA